MSRTVSEVAAEFRPKYEEAGSEDEKREVLRRWDAAMVDAVPDPVVSDDFETVLEQTRQSWASSGRRGER